MPSFRTIRLAAALLALSSLTLAVPHAAAQRPAAQQPAPDSAAGDSTRAPRDTAVFAAYNRTIFIFRAPLGALSSAERAQAASRRVNALVARGGPAEIMLQRAPEGYLIVADSEPVFTVTPGDVPIGDTATLAMLATAAGGRLQAAVRSEIEQRSLSGVLHAIGFALLATVIFLFFLRILYYGRRNGLVRLRATSKRVPTLAIRGFKLLDASRIVGFLRIALEMFIWGFGLFVAYLWLAYVLTRFPYSRPWGEALGAYLVSTVSSLAGGVLRAMPNLFVIVLIIVATRFLTRFITSFFNAIEAETVTVSLIHSETAQPTRRIVVALLWLFAIALVYPYIPGAHTDAFKGISVFAGVLITLGSTGVVGQAMSGLVLMYARALKVGDYVRIAETEGTVVQLGVLSTKIATTKGELVTIPNAVVVSNQTKNFTRFQGSNLVLYTSVTIGYDTPWRQIHALLTDAAAKTPDVLAQPAPFVLQTALSDFYVEYQLNVYVAHPERRIATLSALHANIQDAFNEFGVQILSPHFMMQPDKIAVVPPGNWYAPPAREPAGASQAVHAGAENGSDAASPGD